MASKLPVLSGQEVVRTFEKLGWRFARQSDYAEWGGVRHIGKSKQPTLSICTLVNGEYEIQQLRGNQIVVSTTFPNLKLTAAEILKTF